MLTHIVWWTFKPQAGGRSGAENAALVTAMLKDLRGRIPALKDLTVSATVLEASTESAELVLVTRHDDAAGLAAYAAHPDHQKVAAVLKDAVATRNALDFTD